MKRTPLRKRSKRKESQWREYVNIAKIYIAENPYCHIKSPVCNVHTECVHHKKGRGIYLADVRYFAASCSRCNLWLETAEGKKWGYANGFRLDRIGI